MSGNNSADRARRRAVRARMADTGETYSAAARALDRAAQSPGPQVAERDWSTRARVRITALHEAGAPGAPHTRRFAPGEELEMVQWGRAGRDIDRDSWWTTTDIDAAFIVPAGHVEVLAVLHENPPTWAEAALPAGRVAELLGPDTASWAERGVIVVEHWQHYQVRTVDGELLGLVDRDHGTGELVVPERFAGLGWPVQYRAVISDDEMAPRSVPMPGGFVPVSPARTADAERHRWSSTLPGVVAPVTIRP